MIILQWKERREEGEEMKENEEGRKREGNIAFVWNFSPRIGDNVMRSDKIPN